MNRKIVISAISIVSSLVILGGTTFALFDDSATQTENTFAVGNADLQIAPDDTGTPGTFGSTIPGPNFSGIFPGEIKNFDFWLKNASTSEINLDVTGDVSSINPGSDGVQDIDNALLISWVCDPGDNGFGDDTPTSEFSPRAWLNGGNAGLGSFIQNDEVKCRMIGELPSSSGNEVSDEQVVFDVEYGATQATPSASPSPSPSVSPSPSPSPSPI